ncbi:hypothetical protein GCM10028858_17320 [Halorubrum pallidum]
MGRRRGDDRAGTREQQRDDKASDNDAGETTLEPGFTTGITEDTTKPDEADDDIVELLRRRRWHAETAAQP